MTVAWGRALGGAAAVAAAVALWAGPAASPAAAYVCSFGIDSPSSADPSGSASVSFRGPFTAKGQADRVVEITFKTAPGDLPAKVTRSGAAVGPDNRYDIGVGGLSLNGRYTAQVLVRQTDKGLINCAGALDPAQRDPLERTASVTFSVSVKARPPTDVRASFDAGPPRTAVVTWGDSPDPDTEGYELSRTVGSGPAEHLDDVPSTVNSWTDRALPDTAARITYSVRSARRGPLPNTTSERSDAVTAALDVPAPPPPPTTTTLPPGGTGGTTGTTIAAGPGTTAPAGPANKPATSAGVKPFVLGQAVPGTSSPGGAGPVLRFPNGLISPAAAPPAADGGGYQPTLAYPPQSEQIELPITSDNGDQALVGGSTVDGGGRRGDRRTPQLAYVAGALLSAVVAAHILWLRGQVLGNATTPDDALPVEPTPMSNLAFPAEPPPPAAPPPPRPAAAGRPILVTRPGSDPL